MKIFQTMRYKMPRSSTSQKKINPPPAVFSNPLSSVANHAPTYTPPTFGQTIKEGLAFGTGSAIAHRIFNPFPTQVIEKKLVEPCEKERTAFEMCMKSKSTDDFCGNEQISYTQCLHLSKQAH